MQNLRRIFPRFNLIEKPDEDKTMLNRFRFAWWLLVSESRYPTNPERIRRTMMKGKLLTGLLAASLCFAPWTVVAQDRQPESGQTRYEAFREAQQQQWRKTADLRQQVLLDRSELTTMLVNPKTTEDALLKKQRELQESRAKLEKEQLLFLYQMKRKYPEVMESYGMMGYGTGMGAYGMMGGGYGMGPGMMGYGMGTGYGMGPGMMGYGMGTGCGMGYGMMGDGYGMGSGTMGGYHMGHGMTGGHQMGPGMMGGPGQ
jgi:hypothetical protein